MRGNSPTEKSTKINVNPTSILASRINMVKVEIKEMMDHIESVKGELEYKMEETETNVAKVIQAQKKEFARAIQKVMVIKDKDFVQDDKIFALDDQVLRMRKQMSQTTSDIHDKNKQNASLAQAAQSVVQLFGPSSPLQKKNQQHDPFQNEITSEMVSQIVQAELKKHKSLSR